MLASLGCTQELDPSEARPTSPPSERRVLPERVLLVGIPTMHPASLPGVAGAFGLGVYHVEAAGPGAAVSARLRELRQTLPSAALPQVHYQILSQDPRTLELGLSDVMRLPLGSDEEATPVVRTMPPQPPADDGDVSRPKVAEIELTLERAPARSVWTRHLTFTDYRGDEKDVPIAFEPDHGLTWRGVLGKAGLATLRKLADTGNRSHWDDMKLRNKGDPTALDIARFRVVLHYGKSSVRFSSEYEEDIPIVDGMLDRTLAAGVSSIDLDDCALAARKSFGGITEDMDPVVQMVAADIGKSGSDGRDEHGSNPKYGEKDENLCSEFVSWYYHEAGVVIAGEDFRDITSGKRMEQAFSDAGRSYEYDSGIGAWIQSGGTARYIPRPGDSLARYRREYEHTMMVLDWNDATKVMTVVNGPWPVTVRRVPIQELEESGYDFRVGRIR